MLSLPAWFLIANGLFQGKYIHVIVGEYQTKQECYAAANMRYSIAPQWLNECIKVTERQFYTARPLQPIPDLSK
jgi:hypothetical protein